MEIEKIEIAIGKYNEIREVETKNNVIQRNNNLERR